RESTESQTVVVLVECDMRIRDADAQQVREEPAIVRALEIAVADDERVVEHDELAEPYSLHEPRDKSTSGPENRDLVGRRIEWHHPVAARDANHAVHDRRALVLDARNETAQAFDAERAVQLRIGLLGRIDQDAAAGQNPLVDAVSLVRGVRTR